MIVLDNVSKIYGANKKYKALNGVSLKIKEGEMVGLIGRSGSGKSTLLNMISGLDTPTGGQVLVNSQNITGLTEDEKALFRGQSLGFVFQFFQLLPTLTVLENVLLPLEFQSKVPENSVERAKELLELVGLTDHQHKLPSAMSGGEQQRAAIARALINNPSLLLADEPTGNLDSETSTRVIDIFNRLSKEGMTIVIVTHQPDLGFAFTRTLEMQDGLLKEDLKIKGGVA